MYKLNFEVRDNELDAQGVVNNANYMIYYAHTRHKFLNKIGINFSEMAKEKQFLFLLKTTIEYKRSLQANDIFYVTCKIIADTENDKRFAFEQEIRLQHSDRVMSTSLNFAVCVNGNDRNRPYLPELIIKAFN